MSPEELCAILYGNPMPPLKGWRETNGQKLIFFFSEWFFFLFMGSMWEQTVIVTHPSWYRIGCCASALPLCWTLEVLQWAGTLTPAEFSTDAFILKHEKGTLTLPDWYSDFFYRELNIFGVKTFLLQFPLPEIHCAFFCYFDCLNVWA